MADNSASHETIIAEYGAPVRAILWDFDGTLGYRDGMWVGCLVEVLDEHEPGHGWGAADFRPSLRDGFPWHAPDVPHLELATPDAWWAPIETLLAAAYAQVGYDEERARALAALARTRYADPAHSWRLYEDALPTLGWLRDDGWRHVVLSNHVPELEDIIDGLGLGELIHAVVNSARTGYEKPHPEAFAAGRVAAGDPAELWMVGDNPVADVAGAEAAGIQAVLVRGSEGVGLAEAAKRISRSAATGR
jgi:putative hydrolase of the HAD superfamily